FKGMDKGEGPRVAAVFELHYWPHSADNLFQGILSVRSECAAGSWGGTVDRLLVVGNNDSKLEGFLVKLGYEVVVPKEQLKVTEILENEIFDLVLIESGKEHLAVQFCEFLRGHEASRAVPIVCVTADPLEKVELRRM